VPVGCLQVRIDMSEYMEKHSVSRLIGAPPGYVGFEEVRAVQVQARPHVCACVHVCKCAYGEVRPCVH